jgi:hypothetical protein
MVRVEGLADMLKSGVAGCETVTVTVVVWVRDPLVAVTVTV